MLPFVFVLLCFFFALLCFLILLQVLGLTLTVVRRHSSPGSGPRGWNEKKKSTGLLSMRFRLFLVVVRFLVWFQPAMRGTSNKRGDT